MYVHSWGQKKRFQEQADATYKAGFLNNWQQITYALSCNQTHEAALYLEWICAGK